MAAANAERSITTVYRFTSTAALGAVLVLFALPALLRPHHFPTDDSLFYMQVARNIVAGEGSTFNTVTATNGYHPLWMLPCIVAAALSGGEPMPMLRLAFAMQILLAWGCLLLFRHVARRLEVRSWPLGVPILAAFFLTGMYGSESHLNGFCVLAALALLLRVRERGSPRDGILLGLLLGLAVLARLDNAFLAGAVLAGVAIAPPAPGTSRVATFVRAGIVAALVVAPYLAWNLTQFGHLVPISGAIKSTFPRVEADARNLGILGLVTCAIAALGVPWVASRHANGARRLVIGSLTAGALAHGLYVVLFTNHNTHWSWYYVSGVILSALLLCVAADYATARVPWLRTRTLAIGVIALLTIAGLARGWARYVNSRATSHNQFMVRFLPPAANDRWEIQFARYMEHALPRGAGVLVFDYPGHLAFYSSLRIVPSDGLVGDYRYDSDLRRMGLRRYLASHGIGYYVGLELTPPDSCRVETIYAPVAGGDVGGLVLCPENLLATTRNVVRGVPEPELGLYRVAEIVPRRGAPPPPMLKHGALW